MNILAWIVLGGVAGWLAGLLTKGAGQGLLMNIVVGIVGAFLGGWLFSMAGTQGVTGFDLYSLLVAVVGAVVLLVILRAIRR
ncbi:MAG: GlsB/YeaQ/YmgE family stress response membrane protein [Trueperaceae bacterium]